MNVRSIRSKADSSTTGDSGRPNLVLAMFAPRWDWIDLPFGEGKSKHSVAALLYGAQSIEGASIGPEFA